MCLAPELPKWGGTAKIKETRVTTVLSTILNKYRYILIGEKLQTFVLPVPVSRPTHVVLTSSVVERLNCYPAESGSSSSILPFAKKKFKKFLITVYCHPVEKIRIRPDPN